MNFIHEENEKKVTKIVGQKLFVATRRGVKLLLHRLLKGEQDFFDISMCQLIRANVAMRDDNSLVDGGKWQLEEMPKQGLKVSWNIKLAKELQEEELP